MVLVNKIVLRLNEHVIMCGTVHYMEEMREGVVSRERVVGSRGSSKRHKRWNCHSGYKLPYKLYRNLPLPFCGQAGHAYPLDGWRYSS